MPLKLTLRAPSPIPIEVAGIVPDVVRDVTLAQIERLSVLHGNEQLPLAELFNVRGDASDEQIEFVGDMAGVHHVGARMQSGAIHVTGNTGRHLGSRMTGGEITVDGDADDWAGAEMHDGLIRIRGNAGHHAGAAYPGSEAGMTGGILLIHRSAGDQTAHTMRRGLIAVGGNVGDFAGINMIAGSLFVSGTCGLRPAAGMRRGTLVIFNDRPALLPTFRSGGRCQPLFLSIYLGKLAALDFPAPDEWRRASYEIFHGDMLTGGRGEILVRF
ncbi:MAG TPA: formylmethanofuran dehydrogenase subunit C [Pirellulales bacterium]|nr:formylmethanofuran dehydrogenase subunit C [Pirellulales bacterium]